MAMSLPSVAVWWAVLPPTLYISSHIVKIIWSVHLVSSIALFAGDQVTILASE